MLWPKNKSYKEFDNEKQFLRLERRPLKREASGDEKHLSSLLGWYLLKSVNFISCIGFIFHSGVVPDTRN